MAWTTWVLKFSSCVELHAQGPTEPGGREPGVGFPRMSGSG